MGLGTKDIIVAFYFGYWIFHNTTPFSFWWIALIYICLFIFETIIASIMKTSSEKMEEVGKDIKEITKGFEKRLSEVERKVGK